MQTHGTRSQREGIAGELADIKARQALIVEYDNWLLTEVDDDEFRDDVREIIDEDDRNYKLIESIELNHGVRVEPKLATVDHITLGRNILEGNEYSLLEKIAEYGLLKQMQVNCGHLVHKSAQAMEPDVKMAVGPIAAINSDNASHVSKAASMMEVIGTYQLVGEMPERGLWGRLKDAFVAAKAPFVSGMAEPVDDMPITAVLTVDHRKASALLKEIKAATDAQTAHERYLQLYADLNAHALAEEQVLYETLRSRGGFSEVEHSYKEHDEMKMLLEEIRLTSASAPDFQVKVDRLDKIVTHHVKEEEDDLFDKVKENFTENELIVLSRRFKDVKTRVQDDMAARGMGASSRRSPAYGSVDLSN